MDITLAAIVSRVASYTCQHEVDRETWERAVAIRGLLSLDDPEASAVATGWIDQAVVLQDSSGQLGYNDRQVLTHGHVAEEVITTTSLAAALGYHVLGKWEETKSPHYLEAAIRQADAIMSAPRSIDGGMSIRHERVELWVDTLFMVCPFLARLSVATGESKWLDECSLQLDIHVKHLVDSRVGLTRHVWRETPNSYPQSTFWSRGNGWLAVAIVDSVEAAKATGGLGAHLGTLDMLLASVTQLQDRSGLWRNVLDDPSSSLEVSGSLMFAYAIARGGDLGIVDAELLGSAARALKAASAAVDRDGAVRGVTVPPGGPNAPVGTTSYGQGFFLSAHSALAKVDALPSLGVMNE